MDVAELTGLVRRGGRVKYLFFWGHQPAPDGRVTASCLSQWWPSPFTVDDRTFATAEHYMMFSKATLFGDVDIASRVLDARHPREAKTLGRQVRGFDETTWAARRYDIVLAASVAKFGQDDDLRSFLLTTGKRVLVEASPHDRVWGIGLTADDERAHSPDRWQGLNLLGFALMDAREILREDAA